MKESQGGHKRHRMWFERVENREQANEKLDCSPMGKMERERRDAMR